MVALTETEPETPHAHPDGISRKRRLVPGRRSIVMTIIVTLLLGLGLGAAPAVEPMAAQATAAPTASDAMCAAGIVMLPLLGVCATTKVTQKVGGALKNKIQGTVFEKIVQDLASGWEQALLWSLSWWIRVPSPDLNESTSQTCARSNQTGEVTCPGGSFDNTLGKINDYTFYIQILGLICSIIFVALRMALANRGLVEEAEEVWKTLGRAMFAATFLGSFIILGTRFSDRLSAWLLGEAIGDNNPGQLIKNLMKFDLLTGGLGHVVVFIVLLIGVIGALVQLAMLLMRQAMLIVVVAALPIAAASSGTGPGSTAYQKLIAWTIAFLLFKPVGALVYMIAFTAVRTNSNDPQMILMGIILLGLTVFVLSALMRLIAPAVGTMGGGGAAFMGGMMGGAMGKIGGKLGGGGGGGGGSGSTPLQGRGGGSPPPTPPSGSSSAGKHAAMGAGKGAAGAAGGAGGAAGAAGGPVGAAVAGGVQAASKAKDATVSAANSEAGGGDVNPTGSVSAAAPSTSVPTLTSGSGEHRMAS